MWVIFMNENTFLLIYYIQYHQIWTRYFLFIFIYIIHIIHRINGQNHKLTNLSGNKK